MYEREIMNSLLKVDHREGKLKELFDSECKLAYEYENLEYGDFQILVDNQIKLIFERKTLADLMASIKDGRYKNQKAKLVSAGFSVSQIYYIIEGKLGFSPSSNSKETTILQSALINTTIRDKIACFQTGSLRETFDLVISIYQRVKDDPAKYFESGAGIESQSVVLTSSKDSDDKVFKAILCQIPGLSDKSAGAILAKWNTLPSMLAELNGMSENERVLTLSDIKMNGRKLGKRTVDGVLKHLVNQV